jgi:hypothetical protein
LLPRQPLLLLLLLLLAGLRYLLLFLCDRSPAL